MNENKRKFRKIMFIFSLFSIFILFAFNYNNADYNTYEVLYNNVKFFPKEEYDVGFYYLILIFNSLGFSYQVFLIVLAVFLVTLIGISVKKYSKKPVLVIILYIIFPFMFDIVQYRNLIVFVMLLYSLKYLREFSLPNIFKYIFITLVAATFHSIALIYLIFLLAYIKSINKIFNISLVLTIIFSVLVLQQGLLTSPFMIALFNRINGRILYYIQYNASVPLSARIQFLIYVIVFSFSTKFLYFKSIVYFKESLTADRFKLLSKVGIISMFFIVFILVDPNFFRMFRNVLIVYYILFSYFPIKKIIIKKPFVAIVVIGLFLIPILSFFNFLIIDETIFNSVTKQIVFNNYVLEIIFNPIVFVFVVISIVTTISIYYKKNRVE